jgi:hypothetical protein
MVARTRKGVRKKIQDHMTMAHEMMGARKKTVVRIQSQWFQHHELWACIQRIEALGQELAQRAHMVTVCRVRMKVVRALPQRCFHRISATVECTSWADKQIASKDQVGMRKLICLGRGLTGAQNRDQTEQTRALKVAGCIARDSLRQHGTLLAEEHQGMAVLDGYHQSVAASTLRTVCY